MLKTLKNIRKTVDKFLAKFSKFGQIFCKTINFGQHIFRVPTYT